MKPWHEKPGQLNEVWALDVALTTSHGRRFPVLGVIEPYSRQVLAAEVLRNLTGEDVVRILSHLVARQGAPECLLVDRGRIFTEVTISRWAAQHGIQIAYETARGPSAKERLLRSVLRPPKQLTPIDR